MVLKILEFSNDKNLLGSGPWNQFLNSMFLYVFIEYFGMFQGFKKATPYMDAPESWGEVVPQCVVASKFLWF